MEFIITTIVPTVIVTIIVLGMFRIIKLSMSFSFICLIIAAAGIAYAISADLDFFAIDFSGLPDNMGDNLKEAFLSGKASLKEML